MSKLNVWLQDVVEVLVVPYVQTYFMMLMLDLETALNVSIFEQKHWIKKVQHSRSFPNAKLQTGTGATGRLATLTDWKKKKPHPP